MQGCDGVINLVGILKGAFEHIHVEGAQIVAEAAAKAGCSFLLHMSAIGADSNSPSRYGRSKGDGEQAVLNAFPKAIIFRPSIVFGREDQFINRFAAMIQLAPVVPIIGSNSKFQPIFVGDVAAAVAAALDNANGHAGQIFELGGPEQISMGDLNRRIARNSGHDPAFVEVPDFVAQIMAYGLGWLPGAPITSDQFKMLQQDNVVAKSAKGLNAFDITPTPMGAVMPGWMERYAVNGRFGARAKVG